MRTITWPLVRPGLAAAFLLSMIESLADFGNPIILGGNRKYMATEVYLSFTGRFNPNEAAVYGVVLLVLVLGAFFLQRWWLGGGSFVTVTGKPTSGALAPLPRLLEGVARRRPRRSGRCSSPRSTCRSWSGPSRSSGA
jgi:iron(III) transport system permease protein